MSWKGRLNRAFSRRERNDSIPSSTSLLALISKNGGDKSNGNGFTHDSLSKLNTMNVLILGEPVQTVLLTLFI
jgi:hypothetical protein